MDNDGNGEIDRYINGQKEEEKSNNPSIQECL